MSGTPERASDENTPGSQAADGPAPADVLSGPREERTQPAPAPAAQREIGGRNGPDPTRYGDWEKAGRCIDF